MQEIRAWADVRSRTRCALADHGTLFLDEIGDMPLELQPKLVRVLQEREFEPVGSIRTTRVDVRVVAATNRDLRHMVADKELREDLYYRLNIFPVCLPPLRERIRDIPELVNYFVQHYAESMGKRIESIPEETMRVLVRHPCPGNIRELQNYIARAVILSTDGIFESLPLEQFESPVAQEIANPTLEEKVRQEIIDACRQANWMLGGPRGAAARLGLKRTTLFHKMRRLGIRRRCRIQRTEVSIRRESLNIVCGLGARASTASPVATGILCSVLALLQILLA